jgi:hypothetical protein
MSMTGCTFFATELGDMCTDGKEDGSGGSSRCEAEREADVAVEIAAAERDVVTVGEAEAGFGKTMPERAQHARLSDTGLAGEDGIMTVLATGVYEAVDRGGACCRDPQVRVGDLFREGRLAKTKVREPATHRAPPFRPTSASRSAPGGSKGTSSPRRVRLALGPVLLRRAFSSASTRPSR